MQEYRSVLKGSTAARPADKLLEHCAVYLPEGSGLSHLSQMVYTKPETKLFQVLCVVSYGGRQQGEGVFDSDSSHDDLLTQTFQAVFTVRGSQVQKANGILRRQVNSVRVEKLQEGSVDGVRELADLYDVLLILRPLGAKHGAEMFTPDL